MTNVQPLRFLWLSHQQVTRIVQVLAVIALSTGLISCKTSGSGSAGGGLDYPQAHRGDQTDSYHGVAVADPYRWMEDLESTELRSWLKAQDALRAEYIGDTRLVGKLQKRIAALSGFASQSMPVHKGKNTFIFRSEVNQTTSNLFVQTEGRQERLLLDFESMNRDSISTFLTSYSSDGRHITYNTNRNQSRWHEVHIVRVADGRPLPEVLTGYYSGRSNIAWENDGSGFYYARYDMPEDPQAPLGVARVYYHRLGTSQASDRLIYERPGDTRLSYSLRVSHEGRYLILAGNESGGAFNGLSERLLYMDLQDGGGEISELFDGVAGAFAFESNDGARFIIRTTHQAPQARLVIVDIHDPAPGKWQELIPESSHPMQAVSEIGDCLVVQYVQDARRMVQIFDRSGRLKHEIDHLTPSMYGFADNRDSNETYYGISILYDPGTSYRLDVETGESRLYFRPSLQHDPGNFTTSQVFYESRDGTRVPMFILHKKDLPLNGDNPVFLYAYGAWAWSAFPWQGYMVPWMEMGGVYAVANIRGGGEYGEAWHKGGIRRNKQNGIDDYIAAAEWLIANGYTRPGRMIANGGSASGILPAAAVTQRPELFGAAVINFPTLDQIRYIHFGSAEAWIPEFGTAEDPDDFRALLAYSPYHNLRDGTCYPATWLQVGEKDNTTTPMHGYKFAAAMQAAQGCGQPVLLKIAWGAGHSYGLTAEQSRETQAEELVFLVKALGLDIGHAEALTATH